MNRTTQPRLIAMKGLPGSGKSRLAQEIGKRTGWKIIDKDETKDALHGTDSDAGRHAYQITLQQLEKEVTDGASVIYDTPLTFASLYEEICAIAERSGAQAVVVECRCSDEAELQRRIEERSARGLPPHRITDWPAFLAYRKRTSGFSNYPIELPHFIAETTGPLSELTDALLQWLAERMQRSQ